MKINVGTVDRIFRALLALFLIWLGTVDRIFRALLALFLIWLGLFFFDGLEGEMIGILIALSSLLPIYMAVTRSCFVFRWFNIHSLSQKECEVFGDPTKS